MHPTTERMYKEAGMDNYRLSTEDQVKANFERLTKGRPKKHRIDQMYRVRRADKDYIVYNQTIISEDFPGNEVTCSETVGFHDEPQFHKTYDPVSGEPKAIAVAGNKTVYDIPATKSNIMKILKGPDVIPSTTNFVLEHNNVKYGGFTYDEFTTKSFDDLMFKFNNGYYPRDSKPFGDESEIVQQLKKDLTTTVGAMEKAKQENKEQEQEEEEEQVINEGEQPNQKELEEQVSKEEEKERVAVVEEEEQQQQEREDKPRVNTSKSGRFNKKTR